MSDMLTAPVDPASAARYKVTMKAPIEKANVLFLPGKGRVYDVSAAVFSTIKGACLTAEIVSQ